MENKKRKTLSMAALIVSILPTATLVPVFLKITLPEGVNTVWAGINVASAVAGFQKYTSCFRWASRRKPSRSSSFHDLSFRGSHSA